MTPGAPALVARGTVHLDGVTLRLDLQADQGEIVALVGPNGAGKSATLRTLVGLLPLATGYIEVHGRRVAGDGVSLPPHRRSLAWIQQEPALLPRRPVRQQVATFATDDAPTWTNARGDERVDAVLRAVGMDPGDPRPPERLSGGQRQRVAVARSLLCARIALLDEPFSAQDATGAAALRQILRRYVDAGGTGVVVAHRPEDAYLLADRLVVLEHGRVVQTGTPTDLASHPSTPYVARVVGATVVVGEADGNGLLHAADGTLTVADDTRGGPVLAVIRPGAVTLHVQPPDSGSARNILRGLVTELDDTPIGVRVRLDSRPPVVATVTHGSADALGITTGMLMYATVKASDIDVHPR